MILFFNIEVLIFTELYSNFLSIHIFLSFLLINFESKVSYYWVRFFLHWAWIFVFIVQRNVSPFSPCLPSMRLFLFCFLKVDELKIQFFPPLFSHFLWVICSFHGVLLHSHSSFSKVIYLAPSFLYKKVESRIEAVPITLHCLICSMKRQKYLPLFCMFSYWLLLRFRRKEAL